MHSGGRRDRPGLGSLGLMGVQVEHTMVVLSDHETQQFHLPEPCVDSHLNVVLQCQQSILVAEVQSFEFLIEVHPPDTVLSG